MLDKQFLTTASATSFAARNFSIVHLASTDHLIAMPTRLSSSPRFEDDPRRSRKLHPAGQFRDAPWNSSPSKTPARRGGDDRARFGMAGIAVKSGARSAIARLWFVMIKRHPC